MSIIRWNPTRESTMPSSLWTMQKEINRLFDSFFEGGVQDEEAFGLSKWTPAVDIAERENEYLVKVELPGVAKNDVKITLESNILTIRGEKKQEKTENKGEFHRIERSYGSFQRSFTLPASVKNDKIDATYDNGVLTVTLPKAEEANRSESEVIETFSKRRRYSSPARREMGLAPFIKNSAAEVAAQSEGSHA
jgi:HSP20 family protein